MEQDAAYYVKAVKRMIEVIRGEGTAAEREMPFSLPLKTDGIEVVWQKCLEGSKFCEKWQGLFRGKQQVMMGRTIVFQAVEYRVIAETRDVERPESLMFVSGLIKTSKSEDAKQEEP